MLHPRTLDLILEVVDAAGIPVGGVRVVTVDGRKKQAVLTTGTNFLRIRSGSPTSGPYLLG